jgi:hypothetical protein
MARYFGRWYIRSIPQVLYPKTEFREAGARLSTIRGSPGAPEAN